MRGALFLVLILVAAPSYAGSKFFEERYRGWLWFEDKTAVSKEPIDKVVGIPLNREEMQRIKAENEQFAEELDLLKHVMIRYPDNIEHVRRYKEKERQMLENAVTLSKTFITTNFLYPDIADELENPQNLYGRKVKKETERLAAIDKLKDIAGKVELFLFFKSDCGYCELLEKHLARFAARYGFKVEAVSADGGASEFFKTHNNKELIERLGLTQMPTVIAVTNDSRLRFELARGAVSVTDLEEKALLMADFLANSDLEERQEFSLERQKDKRRRDNGY